jgi:hypothetical protein
MCRSIKTLRRADATATEQEVHDAALQFVRKISGFRAPSRVNAAPFEAAVGEITDSSRRLLAALNSSSRGRTEGASRLNSNRDPI